VWLRNKLGSATLLVAFLFIFFLVVLPLAALFGLLLARLALVMLFGLSTVLTLSWLARLTTLLAGLSTLLTLLFHIVTHELPPPSYLQNEKLHALRNLY
jgi:hypothetical protein